MNFNLILLIVIGIIVVYQFSKAIDKLLIHILDKKESET